MLALKCLRTNLPLFLDAAHRKAIRTAAVYGRIHLATVEVQDITTRLILRRSTPVATAAVNANESATAASEIA